MRLPSLLVIDASVALKWVLNEEGSEQASAIGYGQEIVISVLFWAEAGNAVASRVRRGELARLESDDAFRDLRRAPIRTEGLIEEDLETALAIAHDLRHPIYDCCYLALALREHAFVLTAGRRFRTAVIGAPALEDRVILLSDIAPG